MTIQISVVIPTYNRLDRLQRVLTALEAQTCSPDQFEVVVVSDGATDGTNQYLEQIDTPLQLRPVLQPNQGVAAARNNGVDAATGEIVLFVDDDVIPAPVLIAQHLDTHRRLGPDVVVLGPMLTPDDHDMQPWVAWEQAMLYKQYAAMTAGKWAPTARQFYTGNTSVARRHVLDAGGFDTTFRRAEDVELAYRMAAHGVHFAFQPDARAYHYAERSFVSWIAIPYAYGRNDVIFARDKGQRWLLPTVLYEFRLRNVLVRGLTWLCLDRPVLTRLTLSALKNIARIGHRPGVGPLSRFACSGMWNLRLYQGIADELGGRQRFFAGVAAATERPGQGVPGQKEQLQQTR